MEQHTETPSFAAKRPFSPFLDRSGVVILDGGLASELETRGAELSGNLWSARVLIERPDLVRAVHLDYFRAGANVATTATYQASAQGLLDNGYAYDQARQIVASSVRLAQEARDIFLSESPKPTPIRPIIAGSAGTYGAYLADGAEYRGNFGRALRRLVDFHRARAEWLIEAGVDILAFETVPCLDEAEAIGELLAEFPDTPAWVAFSCRDDAHVREGQTIEVCARALAAAPNVVAIGVNCTAPWHVTGLIPRLTRATDRLVVVYPNRGEDWNAETGRWIPEGIPVDFGALAVTWRELGAKLIGGCCRTSPEDIRAIAAALQDGPRNPAA